MEIVKNTAYFEEQFESKTSELTDPVIQQLVSDMLLYSNDLETANNQIPPGENRPQKPKPSGAQSIQFKNIIMGLDPSTDLELLQLLEEFLGYIEVLESQSS